MRKTVWMVLAVSFCTAYLFAAEKLSTEKLIQNLNNPSPSVRQEAARELGDRGEKLGVEALLQATSDKDPNVQLEVVKALGKINHPTIVSSLSTATRNTGGDAQKEAIHLLTEQYIPTKDRNALQQLWASIQDLFNPSYPAIVEPWIQVDDEAINAILFALDQKESENRVEAAAALGILRAEQAVSRLAYYLRSPNERMVRTCIRSIGTIGKREAGAELVPLLKNTKEEVVKDAVRVLGIFRYRPALAELQQFLDYTNKKDFRRVALQAISRIADPSSESTMRKYMNSDDKELRQYAIEALGRTGLKKYIEMLQVQFQREKSQQIKLAMCFSLYLLGESAYIDSLVRNIGEGIYQDQVREYFFELGQRAVPSVAAYLKTADKSFKLKLIQILSEMRQPSAIPYLEPYLKDENQEIAQAATDAIRILKRVQSLTEKTASL